jgi:hypothetical protein
LIQKARQVLRVLPRRSIATPRPLLTLLQDEFDVEACRPIFRRLSFAATAAAPPPEAASRGRSLPSNEEELDKYLTSEAIDQQLQQPKRRASWVDLGLTLVRTFTGDSPTPVVTAESGIEPQIDPSLSISVATTSSMPDFVPVSHQMPATARRKLSTAERTMRIWLRVESSSSVPCACRRSADSPCQNLGGDSCVFPFPGSASAVHRRPLLLRQGSAPVALRHT